MTCRILILNGPNLNLLGTREPEIYGRETLDDIEQRCHDRAAALGAEVTFRQTNQEGTCLEWIAEARGVFAGIIINPAAWTHTSIALHDALKIFDGPIVEVHLSNPHARESFRHHSHVAPVATGTICGFGSPGYELALEALVTRLRDKKV